jgi:hypothetical protein
MWYLKPDCHTGMPSDRYSALSFQIQNQSSHILYTQTLVLLDKLYPNAVALSMKT